MEPDKGKSDTRTLVMVALGLATGTLFAGRYRIIEDLGQGGMGRVYKALDQEVGEKVALKLLRPEVAGDEAMIGSFRNELKLARQITHHNVCRMYDLGKESGELYLTMEFVDGEDLKSFIRRVGQVPVGKTLSIAKQVAGGLAEAHHLGIVHRDLKPQNIMIDGEGNAKVMDFGIARTIARGGETREGMIIGSPEYMSPEQAEGRAADQKSDLYALGLVLFEMLTGRLPFEGKTALDVVLKHKTAVPPDPRALNPQIPAEVSRLVLKCLEKEPPARFQSAEELISDLDKAERALPAVLSTTSPLIPGTKTRKEKPAIKKRSIIYGTALVLAVSVAVAGFFLLKGSKPKSAAAPERIAEKPVPVASSERPLSLPAWKNSIAVLPFRNLSSDPEQEYFCEGMTEQLISNLSHIKELKVIARTSVMVYKSMSKDVREIGQELGVANVLEGSVRKAGNKIRITAQLINAGDGSHIWNDDYDRSLDDIFAIQDEVSRAIAGALKLTLTPEAASLIKTPQPPNVEVYDLCLRARHIINTRYIASHKESDFEEARALVNKAIDLDPGYAEAYLAMGYLYEFHYSDSSESDREIQRQFIQKAYDLNLNSAEANAVMGLDYCRRGDLDKAFGFIKRALEINPNSWGVCHVTAIFFHYAGLDDKDIEFSSRALELEPLNSITYRRRGYARAVVGDLENARRDFERSLELLPDAPATLSLFARVLVLTKDFVEADEVLKRLEKTAPDEESVRLSRAFYYAAVGDKEKSLAIAKTAHQYALLGMKDEAISHIESEIKEGGYVHSYVFLTKSWIYDKIRDDPRFQAIVARQKAAYEENLKK
jgi:eukaryotic-like serine/threonine-protein kinase